MSSWSTWADFELDNKSRHCRKTTVLEKTVDVALRKIIQSEGGKSEEQTNEYVEKLKSNKRYKRDVY